MTIRLCDQCPGKDTCEVDDKYRQVINLVSEVISTAHDIRCKEGDDKAAEYLESQYEPVRSHARELLADASDDEFELYFAGASEHAIRGMARTLTHEPATYLLDDLVKQVMAGDIPDDIGVVSVMVGSDGKFNIDSSFALSDEDRDRIIEHTRVIVNDIAEERNEVPPGVTVH